MSINWYPGHIAKAERKLKEKLSLVDVVIEVLDARIPQSSIYDNIEQLIPNKPRLILLNKADLADSRKNSAWQKHLSEKLGQKVILTSSNSAKDISSIIKNAIDLGKPSIDRIVAKGRLPRPIRVMVIGMPNVGKSSIINKLIKTSKVKVGDKAGVTRTTQWVRINPKLELMDTPGVIPMKLEDQERAYKLAMVNSVGEAAYDTIEVSKALLTLISARYKSFLLDYYKISSIDSEISLEDIAKSRKLLLTGDKLDINRSANLVLSDFRQGKIGRITLEDAPRVED